MQLNDILRIMRLRLGEALATLKMDVTNNFSDPVLAEYVRGVALELGAMGITDSAHAVDVNGLTISPEPTAIDGVMLAAYAVSVLVGGDLSKKVRDGEVGVVFSTGADSVSTATAATMIKDQGRVLDAWYRQVKALKLSGRAAGGARIQ